MGIKSGDDLQQFLKDISSLVNTIKSESAQKVFEGDSSDLTDLRRKALENQEIWVEPSMDGDIQISVAPDLMKVFGTFTPPGGAGLPLTLESVEKALTAKGVVWGVNFPWIKGAISDCNLELKTVTNVLVAKGIDPVDFWPEGFEILPSILEKTRELDERALFVDFKNKSPFIMVTKGEILTKVIPAQEGVMGINVNGIKLPYKRITHRIFTPGSGVVQSPEGYRASHAGCFRTDGNYFTVDKLLVLDDGVSYKTGHIDFDGDLMIHGEVSSGFKIAAKGAIYTDSVLDVSEVTCQTNLISSSGVIGRTGSFLKVEGRIKAKFLENIYVVVKGKLEVMVGILNSSVQTLDQLVMGPKGILMGGKVQAQNGIDVFQVGSERGAKTEIICGMDFTALDKVHWSRDQNMLLIRKMKEIELQIARFPNHGPQLKETYEVLRNQSRELTELSNRLVGQIDRNEDAKVVVRGTIFPGNYIEICHVSLVVPKPLSQVKFSLDKQRGCIKIEPLVG